jgi:hypothetical protein
MDHPRGPSPYPLRLRHPRGARILMMMKTGMSEITIVS